MSRKSASILAIAAAAALASTAYAQIAIDGTITSAEYGPNSTLALQGTATAFGDNLNELDAAYGVYNVSTGAFNLGITGNLEAGTDTPFKPANRLVLFFDTRAGGGIANSVGGGFNQFGSVGGTACDDWGTDTEGGAAVSPTPGGGSIVNAGFNPEKALEINYWGPNNAYYTNVVNLTQPNDDVHPDKDVYLGQNTPGAGASGAQTYTPSTGPAGTINHAYNPSNTDGITSDPNNLGDPASAITGFEWLFDGTFLNREPGKAVRLMAFISNDNGGYLSNQFLTKLRYQDSGNLEGAGGWGGDPLVDAQTQAFNGDVFLTIFEPAFTAGGDNKWSTNANWAGNFAPNGIEHDAAFKGAGGAVDVDTNVTLGTLKFAGTAGYNLATAAANTITLNAGSAAARVDSLAFSNVINPKIILQSDLRVQTTVSDVTFADLDNSAGKKITTAGNGTVKFGAQTHAPGTIMVVDSGNVEFNADAGGAGGNTNLHVLVNNTFGWEGLPNGIITFNSTQRLAELDLRGGTRGIMPANGNRTLVTNTLGIATDSVGYTATLDLADNDLVVNNGSYTAIKAAITAGFGQPNGGIVSSTAASNQILALFDNTFTNKPTWNGLPVAPTAIIGKYTYFGDVNIDGQVTGDDYTVVDSNLNSTPPVGAEWIRGDANRDGNVTGDDYTVIDSNLGQGLGNPLAPSALSVVPEPASIGLFAAAGIGVLRRRRAR